MCIRDRLGSYGFIKGANTYIVGIMDKDKNDAFEFGYVFEKIILFATDLGIQTCWLGGTFNNENFKELAGLNENEFIPIITPVGYKKIRWIAELLAFSGLSLIHI